MARARIIKPSFFYDEELCDLPPMVRLLFIGLWCLADREGRLEYKPKEIKAQVFPYDKINVTKSLSILEPAFISIYEVNAKKYIAINNFCKHQHPHAKEAKSALPAPPSTDPVPEIPVQAPEKDSAKMPLTLNPYTITLNHNHNHNPETDCGGGGADQVLSGLVNLWEEINGRPVTEYEGKKILSLLETFSESWIEDAMKVAADAGKRKLNYVEGILNRWQTEGRDSGKKSRESFLELAKRLDEEMEAARQDEHARNGVAAKGLASDIPGDSYRRGQPATMESLVNKLGLPGYTKGGGGV